jgi:hypothetical protein
MENLNPLETTVLRLLEDHRGKDGAVSRLDLVKRVNAIYPFSPIGERRVRQTIKHLREQHGAWIGSRGRGYFMAQTNDEVQSIYGYYRGRALSELVSAAKILKKSLPELLGQLSFEFRNQV